MSHIFSMHTIPYTDIVPDCTVMLWILCTLIYVRTDSVMKYARCITRTTIKYFRRLRYDIGGPGIKSRWRQNFPHPSRPALEAHPASYTILYWDFPGGKEAKAGVDHPPPSSAEVTERVELQLYSPSGPSWPVVGCTLPLPSPPRHLERP